MNQRLEDLLKEKRRRQRAKKRAARLAAAALQKEQAAALKKKKPSWEDRRAAWFKLYRNNPDLEPPAGEVLNILDGLDPKGYDRDGRRRSFVETGRQFNGQYISDIFRHF